MRANAAAQVPDPGGILKDPAAFFRRGRSGAGHEELEQAELGRYYARAARLAPPGLLGWLHGQPAARSDGVLAGQERLAGGGEGGMETAATG